MRRGRRRDCLLEIDPVSPELLVDVEMSLSWEGEENV